MQPWTIRVSMSFFSPFAESPTVYSSKQLMQCIRLPVHNTRHNQDLE
jgi:hypothetical protein